MRIALETFVYLEGRRGGTYYIDSLLRALAAIDKENEYLVFNFFFRSYREKASRVYCPDAPNFRPLLKRWPESLVNRVEWGLRIPLIESWLRAEGVKVFQAFRPPCSARVPFVLVSHDIMYVRHPERMYPKMRWGWERSGRPGMDLASIIVVHSEHHKRELVEVLGVDERKVRVVLAGTATDVYYPVRDEARLAEARARLRLPERFALTIGPFNRWWCRYDALIQAVREVRRGHPGFGLAMVGDASSPEARRLAAMAEGLGLGDGVRWLGFVGPEDMRLLLSMAVCNVYPALDTGSSLNVLDSMCAGLPVLTAPVSLLPEMLGDAGAWADVNSPAELAAGLRSLLEDEGLRRAKGEAALARARARTWEGTARSMLALYREVAAG